MGGGVDIAAMVRLLARVIGVGVETADMLVHEVLSRNMRDRRAIARYGRPHWLTGRERQKTSGERVSPFRQWSSSARHGPIGVAISHIPEAKRLGAVVSRLCRGSRLAKSAHARAATTYSGPAAFR
jgi:hypothetical protein